MQTFKDPLRHGHLRVSIDSDTKIVNVGYFGSNWVDPSVKGKYDSVEDLPEDIQKKIATLLFAPTESQDVVASDVVGVGKHLSESVFWIYM